MKLKSEGKNVLWWNGRKWLIRESCKSAKVAQKLKIELEKQDATRQISEGQS